MKRSPIKRRTPVKRSNPKRRKESFARAYGSKERCDFVASLPCVVATSVCGRRIENAHIEGGGMGRKADARFIVPLCRFHHQVLHGEGRAWVEITYRIDLFALAADTEKAWQQHLKEQEK